jgi:hypothetical protein
VGAGVAANEPPALPCSMDDLQRSPGDGDRRQVRDRIRKAVSDGRISSADGDIRLTNVSSAASMSELTLIVRDLDQLEAVLPAGSAVPVPRAAWSGASRSEVARSAAASSGRTVPLVILGLVVALLVAGGVGLVLFSSSGESGGTSSVGPVLKDPVSPGATPTGASPVDATTPDAPGGAVQAAPFKLSAAGVRAFIATYRHKFSTTRVVDLTLYGDYVVVEVPVPGKHRHAGYLFRDGSWSDFGGVTADFPGSVAVDLRRLDIASMMRNLAKARRSLHVEDVSTSYVVINYRPELDRSPNVNIYVANSFNESGYLATTLDGAVERAYPYSS